MIGLNEKSRLENKRGITSQLSINAPPTKRLTTTSSGLNLNLGSSALFPSTSTKMTLTSNLTSKTNLTPLSSSTATKSSTLLNSGLSSGGQTSRSLLISTALQQKNSLANSLLSSRMTLTSGAAATSSLLSLKSSLAPRTSLLASTVGTKTYGRQSSLTAKTQVEPPSVEGLTVEEVQDEPGLDLGDSGNDEMKDYSKAFRSKPGVDASERFGAKNGATMRKEKIEEQRRRMIRAKVR